MSQQLYSRLFVCDIADGAPPKLVDWLEKRISGYSTLEALAQDVKTRLDALLNTDVDIRVELAGNTATVFFGGKGILKIEKRI